LELNNNIKSVVIAWLSLNIACNNASNPKENKVTPVVETHKADQRLSPKISHNVLLTNITTHFFSNTSDKDTFKLILIGDSLSNSIALFSIVSHNGKGLYEDTAWVSGSHEEFNDANILVPLSQSRIDSNCREGVKSFFKESNFVKPVITDEDAEINNLNDSTQWEDIKTDPTAIGFVYGNGIKEIRIAYSKKQRKVINYYNTLLPQE
jgi:hypothetical protein